jgi:K+-transporting ATPase, c chain
LLERVKGDVEKARAENPKSSIPVDLVTTSGSGLDPEISPAAAEFQWARVTRQRGMKEEEVRAIGKKHTRERDLGFLGEPGVNVLELNLDPAPAIKLRTCGATVFRRRRLGIGSGNPAKAPSKRTVVATHPFQSCCAVDLSPREGFRFPHRGLVPKRSAISSYAWLSFLNHQKAQHVELLWTSKRNERRSSSLWDGQDRKWQQQGNEGSERENRMPTAIESQNGQERIYTDLQIYRGSCHRLRPHSFL